MNEPDCRMPNFALRGDRLALRPQHCSDRRGACTFVGSPCIAARCAMTSVRFSTRALIRVGTEAQVEVLGSVDPGSPNPRRNTSKLGFEPWLSGDKVETCLRFVSTQSPLLGGFIEKVDTRRRQGGYMSPPPYYRSSIASW